MYNNMDTHKSNEGKQKQQQLLLSPLTEGPQYVNRSCHRQKPEAKRRGCRKLFRKTSKIGGYHDDDDDFIDRKKHLNDDNRRRLLLGVLGCPLAAVSIDVNCCSTDFSYNINEIPRVRSTAQYIIHQYLAATGCLKMMSIGAQNPRGYYKNMYATGSVKMTCCETEISSIEGESLTNSGGESQKTDNVNGCFVLWQMMPEMWSLELILSSGNKVLAGSDGDIVWSHTPSRGTQIAKGPKRPLRRIIQGLDPKNTSALFANSERLGDRKIGEEECFVLKTCAGKEDVTARNYEQGPVEVEVLRHTLYGYFSQKSGLLVYIEDSQLSRANIQHETDSKYFYDDEKFEEVMYWETSIGSSVGDYKEVDGLMIAHKGRSIATVFGFPDFNHVGEQSSIQVQQPYMYRTRFEEIWNIDDIAFNIHGLSSHSFLPPSD